MCSCFHPQVTESFLYLGPDVNHVFALFPLVLQPINPSRTKTSRAGFFCIPAITSATLLDCSQWLKVHAGDLNSTCAPSRPSDGLTGFDLKQPFQHINENVLKLGQSAAAEEPNLIHVFTVVQI